MAENTIINTRLNDLLDILDLRSHITIFLEIEDGQKLIKADKICFIACDGAFMSYYGEFKVIGLTITLGNASILIKEANR